MFIDLLQEVRVSLQEADSFRICKNLPSRFFAGGQALPSVLHDLQSGSSPATSQSVSKEHVPGGCYMKCRRKEWVQYA